MRSSFWIGCILFVLVAMTGFVAASENMENTTPEITEVVMEEVNATDMNATSEVANTVVEIPEEVSKETNVTAPPKFEIALEPIEEPAAPDLVNETLVNFVKSAKNFALSKNKNAAITSFNTPNGIFGKPDMAIFAYDYNGNVIANPFDRGNVGTNQLPLSDSKGLRYVQKMRDVAKSGGGFVEFLAPNIMEKGAVKKKTVYVLDIDGTWWVGAGVFVPEIPVVKAVVTKAPEVTTPKMEITDITLEEIPLEEEMVESELSSETNKTPTEKPTTKTA